MAGLDFNAAAVRFGRPGKLWVAPLGSAEPTTGTAAWPTGWVPLGYTDTGSAFHYTISTANVEVAEELDVLARVTTGRDASVDVALAEMTYKNLTIAFNGGVIEGDDTVWSFEPPDLGTEVRVMLGWDSNDTNPTKSGTPAVITGYPSNDLRFIFRQCLQGGAVNIENRKGNAKQVISTTWQMEKPATGAKILKIMGAATLNPVS